MEVVDRAQALIFVDSTPTEGQVKLLQSVAGLMEARLLGRLAALIEKPVERMPEELEYILVELIVRRFNRVGSEGLKSESISGHKAEYTGDDLAGFEGDLIKWAEAQELDGGKRGRIRFL